MMTDPLFRDDAYLTSCAATVTATVEGGVVLDRTVFYPTGGGQPGDMGWVALADGETIAVTTTTYAEDHRSIVHHVANGVDRVAVGDEVTLRLDWPLRHRLMRMHTALHLLSVVIPLPVSGGSIGPEKSRLDFDMPEAPEDKQALEDALNDLIAADHPVSTEWITDAELQANPGLVKTMSVMPPSGQGKVRLVRIGGIDLQPCGGTHVRSTAEIGPVRLGKIEKKGRQNRRVNVLFA